MQSKSQWSHLVGFFNPLLLVLTKGHTNLEILVEGLCKYVWSFVTTRLKRFLEIFKEWSNIIRSVLENRLQKSTYWKLLTMMNMTSIIDAFLGVFHSEQLDECFWGALRDVTNEEGYYVFESFCQNVKVVSCCLYNII